MKVKDLKEVLRSPIGEVQWTDVWDAELCRYVENGCSVEYALVNYGDWEVVRIGAYRGNLVLSVRR